ncbi:MAG: hypothetical protein HYX34_10060 [Actinobacteria bacterium]|nr:hypothetical protein [Actinomycetota bacterium]
MKERAADQRGATLVEYVLLVSLIALVAFSAIAFFGGRSGASLNRSKSCIEAAQSGLAPPAGCPS